MFTDWLAAQSNVVSWAIQLFAKYGPIPFIFLIFFVVFVMRPHVPRAVPMHLRRAINQMEWTFHIALASVFLSVITSPAILTYLVYAGLVPDYVANAMSTTIVMIVGISYLIPYFFSVHIWFPKPKNWFPNKSWRVSSPLRLRVWANVIAIWILTEIVLIVGGGIFKPDTSSVSASEILQTTLYYTVEGMTFILLSLYIQNRIAWRSPIPGVPLAIDMERRRVDFAHVQQVSTIFLGAGVSKCIQFLAQLQYESAPFWVAAFSFVLSWIVSLGTLIIALIPTWFLMRDLNPANKAMKDIENRIISSKREPELFSLENFRKILDWDEEEIITGSTYKPPRNYSLAILLDKPTREELTAPGSGSAPEEVLTAYVYLAKIADRAGVPLSVEELQGLAEIRQTMRELVERRARLNEGVASNLVQVAPKTNWGSPDEVVSLEEEDTEEVEEIDEGLRKLLGQSEVTSAVGLDQQTIQAWEAFEEKKELMARQEEEREQLAAMEKYAIENFGYDPYAMVDYGYDPYGYAGYEGYGYGYGGYPYGGEAGYGDPYFGTDPYGYSGYGEYGYEAYPYGYSGYPDYGAGYGVPGASPDPYGYGAYGFDPATYGYQGYAGAGYDPYAMGGYNPNGAMPDGGGYPGSGYDFGGPMGYLEPGPGASNPLWNQDPTQPQFMSGMTEQPLPGQGLSGQGFSGQPLPGSTPLNPAAPATPVVPGNLASPGNLAAPGNPVVPEEPLDPRAVYPMGYVTPPNGETAAASANAAATASQGIDVEVVANPGHYDEQILEVDPNYQRNF